MYFYIDGMWTRAEDPRNRTMSDLYSLNYEPSGKEGERPHNSCLDAGVTCTAWSRCVSCSENQVDSVTSLVEVQVQSLCCA